MFKTELVETVIIFLLALILYYFLSSYYLSTAEALAVSIGLEMVLLLVVDAARKLKKRNVKKYLPMIIIPLIALAITIAVVNIYPDKSMSVQRANILSFCGDFLAFLGTFCLGYFIFIQDRMRVIEEKRTKIKLLNTQIENAEIRLIGLSRLKSNNENSGNLSQIQTITYDPDWLMYYYEYESLRGENSDLKHTLKRFFDCIMNINIAIGNGQIDTAIKIHDKYIDCENYSTSRYNTLEAKLCLLDACSDFHVINTKSWIERKETINLINELCQKYYFLIENFVYNWLLKHQICTTNEEYDLQREVVDWLLTKSPEIKEKINYPSEKRIISKVVFDCSLKFSSKSKKVDYVWGEYFLK